MSLWKHTAAAVLVAATLDQAGSPALEHSAKGAMMSPPPACRRGVGLARRLAGQLGCDLLFVTCATMGVLFLFGPVTQTGTW
jgi:hypothetical protein